MSVLFDIVLALILAACAFIGYRHGLVRTLSKFISYILSFALANNFYVLPAKLVIELPFLKNMLSSEEPFAEKLTFLDRLNLSVQGIKENLVVFGDNEVVSAAKLALNHSVAILISSVISFLISFVVLLLLMKLLLKLLDDLITKIPVLKQVNGIFGGTFGLLNGFFWTWMLTNVFVKFFLPMLIEKWPTVFVMEIADSFIVQLCTKINPITYLMWLINLIFH